MARKNKNCHPSAGHEDGIGSGASSTVWIPELQKIVPGESFKHPRFVSAGESNSVKANYFTLFTYNETLGRYHVFVHPKPTSSGINCHDTICKAIWAIMFGWASSCI